MWVAAGSMGAAVAAVYGRFAEVRTETLLTLDVFNYLLSAYSLLAFGVGLLIAADMVRRTTPVFNLDHSIRVFGCATVAVLALFLPQYAFLSTVVPRIAALEPDGALTVHADNGYWQCWDDIGRLAAAMQAHADRIASDLGRYGMNAFTRPEPAFPPDCGLASEGAWPDRWSLVTRENGSIVPVSERLMHVVAAQRYIGGDSGAYRYVAGGYGFVISLLAGAVVALLARTSVRRLRALAGGRRVLSLAWFPRRSTAAVDRRLAARFPALWSARLPAAIPMLAAAPALVLVMANATPIGGLYFWPGVAAVAVVVFLGVRTQHGVRHLTLPPGRETGVFLLHGTIVAIASIAAKSWLGAPFTTDEMILTALGSLFLTAAFQAGRIGAGLTSLAAIVLAVGLIFLAVFAAEFAVSIGLWSKENWAVALALLVCLGCVGTAAFWAVHIEARPAIRRMLIASTIVASPGLGTAFLILVAPEREDFTFSRLGVGIALCLGAVLLSLRLTRNARRVLAYTAN